MFAKLAIKNIKRSIKDYAIYFFTLVIGVAIFYVFNALDSQTVMLDVSDRVRAMIELVSVIMGVVSVFVACILGALIIYASRFLIKRRSKEFGIYLTLGMSKRKISLILLLETVFIGILSLIVGLLLGIVASQFASVLVANMFDANMTDFHFVFSMSALIQTLIYFGIIYVVVMIFNTIVVSRQKLINLLSSSRRNEKIKNKNLWVCTIVFIVAAVILSYAYYLVTAGLENLVVEAEGPDILLLPIALGVIATFMLFWSLSGIILRIVMSIKKVYYSKLNSFTLRQFSSKINTTVASMSVICLMLFFTICILGSALSINQSLHQDIERTLPMDVQVVGIGNNAIDITEIYQDEDVDINEILKDVVTYRIYRIENEITEAELKDNIGNTTVTVNHDENGDIINTQISVIERYVYARDYNKMAKIFQLPEVELADDEYAILANYAQSVEVRNQALKSGRKIKVAGQTFSPKYDKCIEGTIQLEVGNTNGGIIILPDSAKLTGEKGYGHQVLIGNYQNPEQARETEEILNRLDNRFFTNDEEGEEGAVYGLGASSASASRDLYYYEVETKQDIIDNNVGTSALVTFVGLYLGIIFLVSSAAVLALKELSESSDNRNKYNILRKIGASEKMLNTALFWQIFIFFLFPLLIAILHSVFGLMFCNFILSTIGGVNIVSALPGVAAILLVIYGGYFIITYLCSRNIIRERRQ